MGYTVTNDRGELVEVLGLIHADYNDPRWETVREDACTWLEANGINPLLLTGDQVLSILERPTGQLELTYWQAVLTDPTDPWSTTACPHCPNCRKTVGASTRITAPMPPTVTAYARINHHDTDRINTLAAQQATTPAPDTEPAPPAPDLPKVYLFTIGTYAPAGNVHMGAMADDGEILAVQFCSSPTYARRDLHDRESRHPTYVRKYGTWGDGTAYTLVEHSPPPDVMNRYTRRAAADGVPVDPDRAGTTELAEPDHTGQATP